MIVRARACFVVIVVAIAVALHTEGASAAEPAATPASGNATAPQAAPASGNGAAPQAAPGGIFLHSMFVTGGYSFANRTTSTSNGGVTNVPEAVNNGWALNLGLVLAPSRLPELKGVVDFARRGYSDRGFSVIGLGGRYDFSLLEALSLHAGLGITYSFLHWTEPPAPSGSTGVAGSEGFGGVARVGLDWYVLDNLALVFDLRADAYSLNTTVVSGSAVTTINESLAVTATIGAAFRFGEPRFDACQKAECAPVSTADSDGDGVLDAADRCPGTVLAVPVDAYGCAQDEFSFDLEFEFAQFRLARRVGQPPFNVVDFLRAQPEYRVHVVGHTDDIGTAKANLVLSRKRAEEARQFLVDHGIAAERVSIEALGEERIQDTTEEARAQARRIHVRFYKFPSQR